MLTLRGGVGQWVGIWSISLSRGLGFRLTLFSEWPEGEDFWQINTDLRRYTEETWADFLTNWRRGTSSSLAVSSAISYPEYARSQVRCWAWPQNITQKSISIVFCVSVIRLDSSLSKYRKQKQSPTWTCAIFSISRGACFCLRYLLSDESWRIALTQKAMEMDFCVIFCGPAPLVHYSLFTQWPRFRVKYLLMFCA
jgi:hypothetical protein